MIAVVMTRNAVALLISVLALSGMGAKRRSVGPGVEPQPACAALTPASAKMVFAGSTSGCVSGNGVPCEMGEIIAFEIVPTGYDAACGPHQVQVTFGDKSSWTTTTTNTFPSFVHTYEAIGGYAVEATLTNGRSSVKVSQSVTVTGPLY